MAERLEDEAPASVMVVALTPASLGALVYLTLAH